MMRRGEDPRLALDDILLFYILPELPVKSLFRFKSVCKKWGRWISRDPTFIREQSRISLSSPGIVFMGHSGLEFISTGANQFDVPDPSLKFLKGSNPRLEATCNGLLCVSFDQPSRYGYRKVYVCNPVTREWSLIPGGIWRRSFGLAFDPLDSPQVYKLVCLDHVFNQEEVQFEVFSSDTRVWIRSEKKVETDIPSWHHPSLSVFAGGALYWNVGTQFVWYDPQRDLAGVLMLPPDRGMVEPWYNYALGEWKDRLTYSKMGRCEMETWVMSESKWISICQADLDNLIQGVEDIIGYIGRWERIHILPYQGGEFLYFTGKGEMGTDVMAYNMKTGEVTKSQECGNNTYPLDSFTSFTYNNSIVCLHRLSKHVDKVKLL